ncbi:MAG: DUF5615 family PIN-like protein [Chloroflexi bacterium]|nr:DUF5615 family PIN-like protein [Chloroflexota bacterium]
MTLKFLCDQDVYAITARFLREQGHDVTTAADLGHSRSSDTELLRAAHELDRLLITRDRHFGSLVFMVNLGSGVVYLRMTPANLNEVHRELARALAHHSEDELREAFLVVEEGRHRFRRIPAEKP